MSNLRRSELAAKSCVAEHDDGVSAADMSVPNGFLSISDALNCLTQGLWGGLPRPLPVRQIKRKLKGGSVGFGPWKEEAGRVLRDAAIGGKLPIYVFATPNSQSKNSKPKGPVIVPMEVMARLIARRGSIPAYAIRPVMRTTGGDETLLTLLLTGVLLVRTEEFLAWYRSERKKGRWPSQTAKPSKVGRPSALTAELRGAIIVAQRDNETSIAALHRRLVGSGRADVPSPDTLARFVDQLHRETGDPKLLRKRRRRRSG